MIRHSSSLFVSLVLHSVLAFLLFLGYQAVVLNTTQKKTSTEKRVKIQLCNIHITNTITPIPKQSKTMQKTLPKPKQIIKPKPKPKKVQKIVPKKLIKVKKIQKKITPTPVQPEPKPIIEKVEEEVKIISITEESILIEEAPSPIIKKQEKVSLEKLYINHHIQEITQLLSDNLYYPRSARKRAITGTVMVKFKLSTRGEVYDIKVMESKHDILSRAAIETLENLSGKFPKPDEDLTLHLPIKYTLRR